MRLNVKNQEAELIKATEALITAKADLEAQLRSARRLRNVFVESNKKLKLEIADLKRKNANLWELLNTGGGLTKEQARGDWIDYDADNH